MDQPFFKEFECFFQIQRLRMNLKYYKQDKYEQILGIVVLMNPYKSELADLQVQFIPVLWIRFVKKTHKGLIHLDSKGFVIQIMHA